MTIHGEVELEHITWAGSSASETTCCDSETHRACSAPISAHIFAYLLTSSVSETL